MLELKSVIEEWRGVPESLEGGWAEDDLILNGTFIVSSGSSLST
jgi:hypothetical protein